MKFFTVIALVLAAFLIGCSSEEKDAAPQITDFYNNLNTWLEDPAQGQAACDLVSSAELERSRKYAKVLTDGDLCQAALEENFSFLAGEGKYKLLSIEPIGPPRKEEKVDKVLEVQNVKLLLQTPQGEEPVQARSAALIENGKIDNLAGMRLSTIAPLQFAQSLGSEESIPVDPLSAAYYTSKENNKK